ncbi:MAG: hypothetical protein MMC33_001639 [Icmadophila ericetorum]|nr:hypothetical protein [Icmadophila ericetorum]
MDFSTRDVKSSLHELFKRCVWCPAVNPSCPKCSDGETCSLSIQTCSACASTKCVAVSSVTPATSLSPNNNSGKATAGAIAGGVVGGLAAIAIISYLIWRFYIKKRREQQDEQWAIDEKQPAAEFLARRDARASVGTVASSASSVFTRASNVIQIAYIPGVTNRSIESSPELVPPVPPIPAASTIASSNTSPHVPSEGEFFFQPSDLRGSTYSGQTDRSSIAPSQYRGSAVITPVSAQTAMRAKGIPISLKSSGKNSPLSGSRAGSPPPAMPPLNGTHILHTKSSIVGRVATPKAVTVTRQISNSTSNPSLLNAGRDGTPASDRSEAPLIRVQDRSFATPSPQYSNDASTFDDASTDDELEGEANRARRSLMGHDRRSDAITVIQESPVSPSSALPYNIAKKAASSPGLRQPGPSNISSSISSINSSPRNGAVAGAAVRQHRKSTSLNQIIEEATRRATRSPLHGGLGSYRTRDKQGDRDRDGPFSDVNVAGTP